MSHPPIAAKVSIGHVHLEVVYLERALRFYCGVLGFELTQRCGPGAAFISAGGYHHHIGLNTWESLGDSPPPAGTTGLFHLAILSSRISGGPESMGNLLVRSSSLSRQIVSLRLISETVSIRIEWKAL